MREEVADQLERLYRRVEFNDGFELDIVAPNTWLAEWHAHFEIEERLGGRDDFEFLELELGPDDDVLDPGRRLAERVVGRVGHRILVVHVRDDGLEPVRWQPFFRRLNQIRNALVRDFYGNLVLLLAPGLVTEFAAEAPDIWSIGAVMVIGTMTGEALYERMLDYVPALLRFTNETHEATQERARLLGGRWPAALSRFSATARAREITELWLAHAVEEIDQVNTPGNLDLLYRKITGDELVFSELAPEDSATEGFVELDPAKLDDRSYVLEACQLSYKGRFRIAWIDGANVPATRLRGARRCFDLLLVVCSGMSWSVTPGTDREAPVIRWGGALAITLRILRRGVGVASFISRIFLPRSDPQAWLPHIDPRDLGTVPLYRDQGTGGTQTEPPSICALVR